eukprot:3599992-Lingulodinium_polyedra.AAC.1
MPGRAWAGPRPARTRQRPGLRSSMGAARLRWFPPSTRPMWSKRCTAPAPQQARRAGRGPT